MKIWENREIQLLAGNIDKSTKEIYLAYCEVFGSGLRSYDSIQKQVKRMRDVTIEPEDDIPLFSYATVGEVQDLVIPELDDRKKKEKENKAEAKAWLETLIEEADEVALPIYSPPVDGATSLCVCISDTHFGQHSPSFNLVEAAGRLESLPGLIYAREGGADIDEVVLMLLGDMVEGEDIFPNQASHIECSALDQMIACTESTWRTIKGFQTMFGCPVRVETVPGNHGRTSKTVNEKTNWDNVIYHTLRTVAGAYDDPNIIVNANFNQFQSFPVKDKLGLIYHHGVKHTGTPAMREKVAGWAAIHDFDFMCHAHWHEWHIGNWLDRTVVANGCLCGPTDLSQRMAREDNARQGYFKIRPNTPLYGFGWIQW